MSADVGATLLLAVAYGGVVLACAVPLSRYLVAVMEGRRLGATRVLGPVERGLYRLMGTKATDTMG